MSYTSRLKNLVTPKLLQPQAFELLNRLVPLILFVTIALVCTLGGVTLVLDYLQDLMFFILVILHMYAGGIIIIYTSS